ncbi:MAG: NAD-dependent epimerase/dehydratase family protein [Acidobacteria bacterium]|nr:NAD-dependent epimerase/dehydratase family protein [Acidobacteriota bacterium]
MTGAADYAGKRILITGGAGYLATSLVRLLQPAGCRIVRLGRPGASFPPVEGTSEIEDRTGDIRQRAVWESVLEGIDAVFHFAAQTSVYKANEDPRADLQVNVTPMLHLLEACRRRERKTAILFAGTVTEVGIPARLPVDESHPDHPVTIYDVHKLAAETYLKCYARLGFVRGAVLRLSNVYGPGPASSSADRGVLNQMVCRALRGEPLTVYGKGQHLRDYLYVEDAARAFLDAARNMDRVDGQYFVIGSGQGHTLVQAVHRVAERVHQKTGRVVPVVHVEPPAGLSPIEARDFVADTSRFAEATGWKARVPLDEGLDRTVDAFLAANLQRMDAL